MMHLMCANLYDNNADIAFFIGNLAPDCIDERSFKDKNHLRIYQGEERIKKLLELAYTLNLKDPYQFGVLFHLYTDMCWDNGPMADHKRSYKGENWFTDYRQEIRYISKFMYKNQPWAKDMWLNMVAADKLAYSSVDYYPADMINRYLNHNIKVHNEPPAIESKAFPNTLVDQFCIDTVNSFKKWIEKEKLN